MPHVSHLQAHFGPKKMSKIICVNENNYILPGGRVKKAAVAQQGLGHPRSNGDVDKVWRARGHRAVASPPGLGANSIMWSTEGLA